MRDSQYSPPAAISAPATITGRVPTREISCEEMPAAIPIAKRQREVGGAGLDRRVAEHVLHVQGEEEEQREEAGERDQLRRVRVREPVDAEDRQRRERVRCAPLVDHERGQQRDRAGELGDRAGGAPADVGRLDQRVDEQQHPAGGEQRAEQRRSSRAGARARSAAISRKTPPSTSTQAIGLTNITQRQPGPSVSRPPSSTPDGRREPADARPRRRAPCCGRCLP